MWVPYCFFKDGCHSVASVVVGRPVAIRRRPTVHLSERSGYAAANKEAQPGS